MIMEVVFALIVNTVFFITLVVLYFLVVTHEIMTLHQLVVQWPCLTFICWSVRLNLVVDSADVWLFATGIFEVDQYCC